MSKTGKVKVGIIGSQFEADIHAASFKIASEHAEVVAVASPTPGNAAALAKRYGIPRAFTDYRCTRPRNHRVAVRSDVRGGELDRPGLPGSPDWMNGNRPLLASPAFTQASTGTLN